MGKKKKKKKKHKWFFASSEEIDEVSLEVFGGYYYCLGDQKKTKNQKEKSA